MASNTFDGLRAEVNAAIVALAPQIRGLDDLTQVSLSETAVGRGQGESNPWAQSLAGTHPFRSTSRNV